MIRARHLAVRRLAVACLLAAGVARPLLAAPPAWLEKLAAEPTPAFTSGAPAVVLLDDEAVKIDAKGRQVSARRLAVRVLAPGGESRARASISYLSGRDTAKGLGAWLLRDGKEFKLPRTHTPVWVDEVLDEDAMFTEYRARRISYAGLAKPGDVFGIEATIEGGMLFRDKVNIWRDDLPTLVERYSVSLAAGWTLSARIDGDRPIIENRSADGLTWSWELRDRPYRPEEPFAPEDQWFDARLIATIQPQGAFPPGGPVAFSGWSDVAAWSLGIATGQCDRDAMLAEAVGRLTKDCTNPLEQMRAISRHVQELRYVSVSRDLGIGFGYRPRKATDVHARGWGDCKDKANLMCAMLREVGIDAHLAIASIGFGRSIVPEWPNPQLFDHAIVAIPVDASVDLPAVVETKRFGRVLFFDATASTTMLGDLPSGLQGSRVFVLAEGNDELTSLPRLTAAQNRRYERHIELVLNPAGAVSGVGTFVGRGQSGAAMRRMLRRRTPKEIEEWVVESLGVPLRGALVKDVQVADDTAADEVKIRFDVSAPKFCQFLPGNLALVKLDLFSRSGAPAFPSRDRVSPIEFEGFQVVERVDIVLPEWFAAEELPAAVALSQPFGSYANRIEIRDGVLGLERVLTLEDASVPVADYARVRQFAGDVAKADKSSALLRVGAP